MTCSPSAARSRAARIAASVAGSLAVVCLAAGCGSSASASTSPVSVETGSDAAYVAIPGDPLPAATGGVSESDGTTWSYAGAAKDKVTLLYFGYTSCPDVCPTTMADIAVALHKLPAAIRDRIAVQFVSTDPHRDTATQISGWLSGFDPTFRGGRAPIASVIAAARAYGISIDPPRVTPGDYQVTHGAQVLVLAPGGGSVGYFRELAGAPAYEKKLPALVRKYA